MPDAAKNAAEVQRWLTIAINNIFPDPYAAHLVKAFGVPLDHDVSPHKSHNLFMVMNTHLKARDWLATQEITIADVADYSHIRTWLANVEAQAGFVPMPRLAIPYLT